jgi:hypothetical protein
LINRINYQVNILKVNGESFHLPQSRPKSGLGFRHPLAGRR